MYDKETFQEMIRDWQADNAPEYDDLEIGEPEFDEEQGWVSIARDSKCTYQLQDDGSCNIVINYLGSI